MTAPANGEELIDRAQMLVRDNLRYEDYQHASEVAAFARLLTSHPAIIAAAWLHDFVEDGPRDAEHLIKVAAIPPMVRSIVQELTDHYTAEAYPWMARAHRKRHEQGALSRASVAARIVKVCDVMANDRRIAAKAFESGTSADFDKLWRQEKEQLILSLFG